MQEKRLEVLITGDTTIELFDTEPLCYQARVRACAVRRGGAARGPTDTALTPSGGRAISGCAGRRRSASSSSART